MKKQISALRRWAVVFILIGWWVGSLKTADAQEFKAGMINISGATGFFSAETVIGTAFTPNVDIVVTHLGRNRFFNQLNQSYNVGLFEMNGGTLLAQVSVGEDDMLFGFNSVNRFAPISPVWLHAGTTYYVMMEDAQVDEDLIFSHVASGNFRVTFSPEIGWQSTMNGIGADTIFWPYTASSGAGPQFGANFVFREPHDCNDNGIPDLIDLDVGTEGDCNTNGLPDSCDVADGLGFDCNQNAILDFCELEADPLLDANSNGFIDACEECRSDTDVDGFVGVIDFLAILSAWGDCGSFCRPGRQSERCAGDSNLDCIIGIDDFLEILSNWGSCIP